MSSARLIALAFLLAVLAGHALTSLRVDANAPTVDPAAGTARAHFATDGFATNYASLTASDLCGRHLVVAPGAAPSDCSVGKGATQARDDEGLESGSEAPRFALPESAFSAAFIAAEPATEDRARRRALLQVFLM